MGGPIVRTGTTPEFWKNYDQIFGEKTGAKKASKKSANKKTAKKSTSVKAAKKSTKKKAGKGKKK